MKKRWKIFKKMKTKNNMTEIFFKKLHLLERKIRGKYKRKTEKIEEEKKMVGKRWKEKGIKINLKKSDKFNEIFAKKGKNSGKKSLKFKFIKILKKIRK